jgi:Transcription factor WhiB
MSSITDLGTYRDPARMTDTELDERINASGKCRGLITDQVSAREHDATFFPDRQITPGEARAACSGCPVIAECLEAALRVEAVPGRIAEGIYGGRTPEERNNLRRSSRRRARSAQLRELAGVA